MLPSDRLPAPETPNPARAHPPLPPGLAQEVQEAARDPRRRFGRYVVLGEIGRGGMGAVFRAFDSTLGRVVAIKQMTGTDPEGVQRFRREALAVAGLRHPVIIAIHDVGEERGTPYFVMDYIRGETLEAKLTRGFSIRESARVVREVARAIEHAHAHGIIHRDVKPQNILVDDDGRPFLLDFGLARDVGRSQLTRTGQALGTPQYMSPEQVEGQPGTVGPPTDVYALGAVLYRALAGRPPFAADSSAALIKQVLLDPPDPPERRNPDAPPDLSAIAVRCLAKDPPGRYDSARALADDLDRWLAGEVPQAATLARRKRRHRAILAGVGAATVLASAAVGAVSLFGRTGPGPSARIRVLSPEDGFVTREAEVLVRGEATSGDVAAVFVGGTRAALVDGRFEASAPLCEGENGIDILAVGATGDEETQHRTVRLDTRPPGLCALLVAADEVMGTTDDPLAQVTVDGRPAAVDAAGAFRARFVRPAAGVREVSVGAADRAGNAARTTVVAFADPGANPSFSWWEPAEAQRAYARETGRPIWFEGPLGIRFVLVPPGTFRMGSPPDEREREDAEVPHEVTLTRGFYLAATEVTNAQYRAYRPDHRCGEDRGWDFDWGERPVVRVSWLDARAFCEWLGEGAARGRFRLPTEAEWERACRGGTSTAFFWGDDIEDGAPWCNAYDPASFAQLPFHWYTRSSVAFDDGHVGTAPVASLRPNPFGVFDILGNVWEWCADCRRPYPDGPETDPVGPLQGANPIHRGGAWHAVPTHYRAAYRGSAREPDAGDGHMGFRVAADLEDPR